MSDGFDYERESYKRARSRDPETSKDAAADKKLSKVGKRIYEVMLAKGIPMTAEEICSLVPVSGQSGNPRINELMEAGYICTDGFKGTNKSGKEAVLWRIATEREGAFLRKRSARGFPADDALASELRATPDILAEIWNLLTPRQKRAYNGYIDKDDWKYFKEKGIKEHMRYYGEDNE